jgi:hypothetical protein
MKAVVKTKPTEDHGLAAKLRVTEVPGIGDDEIRTSHLAAERCKQPSGQKSRLSKASRQRQP